MSEATLHGRRRSVPVQVGNVTVGGDAPVVVQSMTNTDTADIDGTVRQVAALAAAGSEIVRITVDRDEAAAAVPKIKERLLKIGCEVPTVQYVEATPEGLGKIRANYGTDVMAVTFDPKSVTWTTGTAPPPVITSAISAWAQPLQQVPSRSGVTERQMWIGLVQPDGRVAPLN